MKNESGAWGDTPCEGYLHELIAYKKQNGIQWGTFMSKIDEPASENILLYPNPAHEFFTIELPSMYSKECFAEVLNSSGIKVLEARIQSGQNNIITDKLMPGVYFIRINPGQEVFYRKVMVY